MGLCVVIGHGSARTRELLHGAASESAAVDRVESASSPAFLRRKAHGGARVVVAPAEFLRTLQGGNHFLVELCAPGAGPRHAARNAWFCLLDPAEPDPQARLRVELEKALALARTRVASQPCATRRHSGRPAPSHDASSARPSGGGGSLPPVRTSVGPTRAPDSVRPTKLVAVGASTGGTVAIERLLGTLGAHGPPIVIAQHISLGFSAAFARRLESLCSLHVTEATHRAPIREGTVYVAPAGRHLMVVRDESGYHCHLSDQAPVNRHRPSVDVLFESVAKVAGSRAVGVLLTGMGRDGARGLLTMRNAGASTLAQDERTSVVWGMPRAAAELGAAQKILGLEDIAAELASYYRPGKVPESVGHAAR